MEMTVMTYNIQSGRNLAQDRDIRHAISTIRKESPDILSLNEVQHCTAFCPDGRCQAQAVAEALGYPYFRFGRSIDYEGGEYGNALLSRYPILESAVFPIPDIPEEQRDSWFEPRTHLFCRLDLGGREMIALTSHYGLSDGEIQNAVQETLRLAVERNLPLIFMGDLNAQPDSPLLAPLFGIFSDSAAGMESSALTYPSDTPSEKIDYIFHRGGFATLRAWVPETTDSDHRPLCARLNLSGCQYHP